MSQLKKGAILSYINIILTNIVGLLLTPLIVTNLGTNEYGLYVLIGSLIAYFSLLDFGVGDTVIRYIARYRVDKTKEDESVFLGSILTIFLPIVCFIMLVGILAFFYIEALFGHNFSTSDISLIKKMFIILLFNLGFSLIGNVYLGYINAYERFVFTRTILIIKYLLRALAVFITLSYGGKALAIVIVDTIVNIIFFSVNIFYCVKYLEIKFKFGKLRIGFVKEIFSYSIWLFLLALISSFQWQGGQLLLGFIATTKEISVYAIGVLLGTYYGAFSGAITTMFLPHAARLVGQNANAIVLTDAMIKIGRITSYVLLLILTGFIIFGDIFIRLWVGEEYIDSYYIAVIIMIVYTFPLVQAYANAILEAKQLVKYKGVIYITFIILGTSFGYVGFQLIGIFGVIISICIGWMIAFLLMNQFYIKKLKMQIPRFYREVFVHQILCLFMLFISGLFIRNMFKFETWTALVIGATFYSLLYSVVYYFFVLNIDEKKLLKKEQDN